MYSWKKFSIRFTKKTIFGGVILLILACGPYYDSYEFISFFQPTSSNTRVDNYGFFFTDGIDWGGWEVANQNDSLQRDQTLNISSWVSRYKNHIKPIQFFNFFEKKDNELYHFLDKSDSEYLALAKKTESSDQSYTKYSFALNFKIYFFKRFIFKRAICLFNC